MEKDSLKIGSYAVLPGPKMGLVSAEYLEMVAAIVRKHNIPFVKITGGQQIAIGGHTPEVAETIRKELGDIGGPRKPVGIHSIQACPGMKWCRYGKRDTLTMGRKIEEAMADIHLPAKTKIGISGCARNCCESYIRDIGIFGMKKGWTIVFGGNGGRAPRIGDIIAEGLEDEDVLRIVGKCLDFYRENAGKRERTGRLMARTPVETFIEFIRGG